MKKIVLAAVVGLAGMAASQAGTFFGFHIDTGPGYDRGGWVQPSYGSANVNPNYGAYTYQAPVYGTYQAPVYNGYQAPVYDTYQAPIYDTHQAPLYGYPYSHADNEHADMHQELRAEHRDIHQDLDRQHWAEHQQLNQEAAQGVPRWVLNSQHRAEHRYLDVQHAEGHDQLHEEHAEGHDVLGR